MEISRRSRLQLRLQTAVFVVLFLAVLALLGWLAARYEYQADWTANGRNTLSEPSRQVLEQLDGPIEIAAFARDRQGLRLRIEDLVQRYRRRKSDISLSFVDPDQEPARAREAGITRDGTLVVAYRGREEQVTRLSEQALTNALQRLAQERRHRILFLTGHGERAPGGRANHDLALFARELERKGYNIDTVNLAEQGKLPTDASLLVIASPQVPLLDGEVKLLRRWVEQGGNLLWLMDPGPLQGLEPLARELGIATLPGVIVDVNAPELGLPQADIAVVAGYPQELEVTRDFQALTLFPHALGLAFHQPEGWNAAAFLRTLPRSWTETGPVDRTPLRYDEGTRERPGPLTLGVILRRAQPAVARASDSNPQPPPERDADTGNAKGGDQRIAVIGDGDFLANSFIGNVGNLDLGLAVVRWLTGDDRLIQIRAKTAPDQGLVLTGLARGLIGFGFWLILPLVLLGIGVTLWYRRTRRQ